MSLGKILLILFASTVLILGSYAILFLMAVLDENMIDPITKSGEAEGDNDSN